MTVLPDLEPCAQCDHKRGEHTSTAGGSFNVHPVHYGRCRVTGCDCGEYQPNPSSDQSESAPVERGTPNECCCPVVFGARVTTGHCPIHGAAVLGEDGMREAHAIDRRKRFRVASDEEKG